MIGGWYIRQDEAGQPESRSHEGHDEDVGGAECQMTVSLRCDGSSWWGKVIREKGRSTGMAKRYVARFLSQKMKHVVFEMRSTVRKKGYVMDSSEVLDLLGICQKVCEVPSSPLLFWIAVRLGAPSSHMLVKKQVSLGSEIVGCWKTLVAVPCIVRRCPIRRRPLDAVRAVLPNA